MKMREVNVKWPRRRHVSDWNMLVIDVKSFFTNSRATVLRVVLVQRFPKRNRVPILEYPDNFSSCLTRPIGR